MTGTVIIIPVHNRCATTLACLRHLRMTGDLAAFHVLVIDDGSTDGTGDSVRAEFPGIELLHGDGQLWWTGAMHLGMQRAFGGGASCIVWLNDDCLPEPGALAALAGFALRDDATVVGPACLTEDGAPVSTGFIDRRVIAVNPSGSEVRNVEGLSGYCVAVPRRVWERLGAPDGARFPHYYGDSAYTLAAKRAGFAVVLAGVARVRLAGHAAMPVSPTALLVPALGWSENWRRIFMVPKSPFRLATQWHYLRLKYGAIPGSFLAALRTLSWVAKFVCGQLG